MKAVARKTAWIGFAIGTAAKVAIVFVMVGIFITAYLL